MERAETQLATLGRHRPVDVIKAELASLVVAPRIWRRSRNCVDLGLEESRLACAPGLGLRTELAAAEAAERLETQLVAGRAQLATAAVAGSVADPQASALLDSSVPMKAPSARARLVLAVLIEAGSALGFTLVSVATAHNPPPPSTIGRVAGSTNSAGPQAHARRSTGPPGARAPGSDRHTAAGSRGPVRASCPLAAPRDKPPLPAPGSVPGLQVRSHRKPQLSSTADPLDRWASTGSTWIPLAASRRGTRMPIPPLGASFGYRTLSRNASVGIYRAHHPSRWSEGQTTGPRLLPWRGVRVSQCAGNRRTASLQTQCGFIQTAVRQWGYARASSHSEQ